MILKEKLSFFEFFAKNELNLLQNSKKNPNFEKIWTVKQKGIL